MSYRPTRLLFPWLDRRIHSGKGIWRIVKAALDLLYEPD